MRCDEFLERQNPVSSLRPLLRPHATTRDTSTRMLWSSEVTTPPSNISRLPGPHVVFRTGTRQPNALAPLRGTSHHTLVAEILPARLVLLLSPIGERAIVLVVNFSTPVCRSRQNAHTEVHESPARRATPPPCATQEPVLKPLQRR